MNMTDITDAKGEIDMGSLDYPAYVEHSTWFYVNVGVRNIGGSSGRFRIDLYIDGICTQDGSARTIAAGVTSANMLPGENNSPASGTSMDIVVKCIRLGIGPDITDDTKSFTIPLTEPGEPRPLGKISNLNYPAHVEQGAEYDVNASISNVGTATGTFVLELYENGVLKSRSPNIGIGVPPSCNTVDKIPAHNAPTSGTSMSIVVKCIMIVGMTDVIHDTKSFTISLTEPEHGDEPDDIIPPGDEPDPGEPDDEPNDEPNDDIPPGDEYPPKSTPWLYIGAAIILFYLLTRG